MNLSSSRKLIFGAVFAAATTLAASANTLSVTIQDAGNPTQLASSVTIKGTTIKNVYLGPYDITVNGVTMQAMCIDFNIESYVGDTYSAYETAVGSSNLSNTYSPNEGQEYLEEAYLFSQLVQPNANRLAIQTAAWNIMAYGITSSSYLNYLSDSSYIDAALNNYSSMSGAGYAIISDTSKNCEQEFIVDPPTSVTPEPSSLALMLLPALCFGAAAMRRQKLGLAPIN